MSEPLNLDTLNEFLELQKGRCFVCRRLFAHCGGTVDLAIPCACCFAKSEGLMCVECADHRKAKQ
jgi:hypothetical protein